MVPRNVTTNVKIHFLKIDARLERNAYFETCLSMGTAGALSFMRISKHGETSVDVWGSIWDQFGALGSTWGCISSDLGPLGTYLRPPGDVFATPWKTFVTYMKNLCFPEVKRLKQKPVLARNGKRV